MTASEQGPIRAARRASCANNLKQWGLVFKMYSSEARAFITQIFPRACED